MDKIKKNEKEKNITYLYEGNLLEAIRLISEVASWIRKREKADDSEYKINMYIINKYKDKLIKDLGLELLTKEEFCKTNNKDGFWYEAYILSSIREAIVTEMNKQFPAPWYNYGLSNEGQGN